MSETGRFDDEPQDDDYARGLREEPPVTVEEELEREREGTFARGQEELPEDTVEKDRTDSFARGQEALPEDTFEKDRTDSFARGQEALPEDTFEKVRGGSFAEGQEVDPHEPERIEPGESAPGNVPPRDEDDPSTAV